MMNPVGRRRKAMTPQEIQELRSQHTNTPLKERPIFIEDSEEEEAVTTQGDKQKGIEGPDLQVTQGFKIKEGGTFKEWNFVAPKMKASFWNKHTPIIHGYLLLANLHCINNQDIITQQIYEKVCEAVIKTYLWEETNAIDNSFYEIAPIDVELPAPITPFGRAMTWLAKNWDKITILLTFGKMIDIGKAVAAQNGEVITTEQEAMQARQKEQEEVQKEMDQRLAEQNKTLTYQIELTSAKESLVKAQHEMFHLQQ